MRYNDSLLQRRLVELRKELRLTHRIYKVIILICVAIIGIQRFQLSVQSDKVNMYNPVSIEAKADAAETPELQLLDDKDLSSFDLPELPKNLQK